MFGDFEDFLGGGFPGGHGHSHGRSREPANTSEMYERLGVEKSATEKEIRKAYRKLTKKHHPDRGGDAETFKKIQQANDILTDSTKRELYDQGGTEAVEMGRVPGPSNIFDLFGGGRMQQRERGPQKPEPIKQVINIDLEDVWEGTEKTVTVEILTADERNVCNKCNGHGQYMDDMRQGNMIIRTQRTCPKCRGRGKSFVNERRLEKTLTVYVSKGISDGGKQKLEGEGHDLPDMPNGDVEVIFKVKKHPIFTRKGADLFMHKEITLVEALCGYNFSLKTIRNDFWLRIKSPEQHVTQHNEVIKIQSHGLPMRGNARATGHLYIQFLVVLPTSIPNNCLDPLTEILNSNAVAYDMPDGTTNDTREMTIGSTVRLIGLNNRPELNEQEGEILPMQTRPGTWAVQLNTGQTVAVPAEYLELAEEPEVDPTLNDGPREEDFVDEVSGETIEDMETIQHTPAQYGHDNAYDEDEEQEGVSCRQM